MARDSRNDRTTILSFYLQDGRTPMHDCFSAEAIELLHEYGADITATDKVSGYCVRVLVALLPDS